MMYWDGGTSWWAALLMALGMVAFWGGLIWVVWYLVTHPAPRGEVPAASAAPERILDERFARGEIDVEEYRTRREALLTAAGSAAAEGGDGR